MFSLVVGFSDLGEGGLNREDHIILRMEEDKQVCIRCKRPLEKVSLGTKMKLVVNAYGIRKNPEKERRNNRRNILRGTKKSRGAKEGIQIEKQRTTPGNKETI